MNFSKSQTANCVVQFSPFLLPFVVKLIHLNPGHSFHLFVLFFCCTPIRNAVKLDVLQVYVELTYLKAAVLLLDSAQALLPVGEGFRNDRAEAVFTFDSGEKLARCVDYTLLVGECEKLVEGLLDEDQVVR